MSKSVLIHASFYETGGQETHLCNLVDLLHRLDIRCTIAARTVVPSSPIWEYAKTGRCKLIGTPFASNPRWSGLSGKWAAAFWPRRLRRDRFDVLLTMQLSPLVLHLANSACPDAEFIWNFFGAPHPFGYTENMLRVFVQRRPFDAVIVESLSQGKQLTSRFGVKSPIIVAPHISNAHHAPIRHKLLDTDGTIRMAFIGRNWRYKGIFFLLDLWDSLKVGPASLDFYGRGPDIEGLRAEVRRRKLEAVVKVHGAYNGKIELSRIMSGTDLILLPSEIEGLPLVLLEAMAHGVPFVASHAGAIPDLAENNSDVRIAPLEKAAFASAIEDIVAGIRAGAISPTRLQQYFEKRFARESLESKWASILSTNRYAKQDPILASVD